MNSHKHSFSVPMGRFRNSSCSTDRSSLLSLSSASSVSPPKKDLSTDLRLGLCLPSHQHENSSSGSREKYCSGPPPIKPHLRSKLKPIGRRRQQATFFVKVYMEGVPIGRKLDLFAHKGYGALIRTLQQMFWTNTLCPDFAKAFTKNTHMLTYEDKEGDWMMVGDVPWEMFLTAVKRLKICRVNKA